MATNNNDIFTTFFYIFISFCLVGMLYRFSYDELSDQKLSGDFFGRKNVKWRYGSIEQTEQFHVAIKLREGLFQLDEDSLNYGILSSLKGSTKGLLISTVQNDRFSLIQNFLCSYRSHYNFPFCERILYHHTCIFDDDLSMDPTTFITKLIEEMFVLSPDIGQEIYLDRQADKFMSESLCSSNLNYCLETLVIKKLQRYSKRYTSKTYFIVVNFVEDCLLDSSHKPWNISYILQKLMSQLPSEFKFIFIIRNWSDMNTISRTFGGLVHFDVFQRITSGKPTTQSSVLSLDGRTTRIGFCRESTDVLLFFLYLVCSHYVELDWDYHQIAAFIYFVYIKKFIISSFVVYFWILIFISYVRFRKLPSNDFNVHKSWFYKLQLNCDNIDIHCIIDQRLERRYFTLSSLYKRKTFLEHYIDCKPTTIRELDFNKMCEFERIYYYYKEKTTNLDKAQTKIRQALLLASEKRLSIFCRWLVTNVNYKGVTNKEIETALDIAFRNHDKQTAKALSWCVTKIFYQTFYVYLRRAFHIYPGIQCQCKGKGRRTRSLCSSYKIIVVKTNTQLKGLPQKYKGFNIKIVQHRFDSKSEAEHLSEILSETYKESYFLKINISVTMAEMLFRRHSNLRLICPSVIKSSSYDMNNYTHKNEFCVQLNCHEKGILPIGENHFPYYIHGVPTDIIEGDTCLLSKLRIGDKIGPQTSTGTLGGFVQYLDFDCFLTCAHVMYDMQTLLSSTSDFARLPGAKAYIHTLQGLVECGKVIWRTFDHDDPHKTSVDAALVLLQNNATIDPNDFILDAAGNSCPFARLGLASQYLNSSCLDHDEFCSSQKSASVVGAGAMTKVEQIVTFPQQTEVEIDFLSTGQTGASAGANVVYPLWMHTPAHLQLATGQLARRRSFCMYNQIIINLGLKPGDSGTCIYLVGNQNKNGCIGMAIAFCGGWTIVTPLKDILKRISS